MNSSNGSEQIKKLDEIKEALREKNLQPIQVENKIVYGSGETRNLNTNIAQATPKIYR